MSIIRAAVVQCGSHLFDNLRTLEALAKTAASAAGNGAKIAVYPEAYVGGYPKGLDFGARVGMRSSEGRKVFQRYFDAAIAVPGPETEWIGSLARAYGLVLVVGVIEREGGTLYCTVLFFGDDGALLGKRRKLMPTALERLVWGFGDGSTLAAVDTAAGRVGGVICWENFMPALRMSQYAQGVQFYCAPTVDDRDSWVPAMRMIAMEGRCFVLSACQHFTRAQAPGDVSPIQGDDPETVLIRGGSLVVDPMGDVIAGPVYDEDTILFADLDTDLIARGKYDLDTVGHYARPDIFSLQINTAPQRPVTFGTRNQA
ncbi:MAG: carbon-nitrogen hydrolase family protein [Alphaproteobacteria bacterium]